ncbi:hypothetical protein BMS3Bbin15_00685 [archaeon BMS3Bbin15]|nr:hypothetical protein BMS3Bbin15_00685 [archaeon BMS3Bbin15]
MVFENILKRFQRYPSRSYTNLDDYFELEVQESYERQGASPRLIKVCKLRNFADINSSARDLGSGNVVILDIKPLAERSINELKLAIDEIKEIVKSMNGDIAGLSDYHLILTPHTMKIERGEKQKKSGFDEVMENIRKRTGNG